MIPAPLVHPGADIGHSLMVFPALLDPRLETPGRWKLDVGQRTYTSQVGIVCYAISCAIPALHCVLTANSQFMTLAMQVDLYTSKIHMEIIATNEPLSLNLRIQDSRTQPLGMALRGDRQQIGF